MPGSNETDIARLREERASLIAEALARPSATAHFQSKPEIDASLEEAERRERRIAEIDAQIAAYEADHA
jgi:hypothetical protein